MTYLITKDFHMNPLGFIHGLGTTFETKDLRTKLHWISKFIMIYYYLINKS